MLKYHILLPDLNSDFNEIDEIIVQSRQQVGFHTAG